MPNKMLRKLFHWISFFATGLYAVKLSSTLCISMHAVRVSTPVYLNACCPGINPLYISMHAVRVFCACCPGINPRVSQCMLSGYQPPCISMHAVRVSTPVFLNACCLGIKPRYLTACCPSFNPRVSQCMHAVRVSSPAISLHAARVSSPAISLHTVWVSFIYIHACSPASFPMYHSCIAYAMSRKVP